MSYSTRAIRGDDPLCLGPQPLEGALASADALSTHETRADADTAKVLNGNLYTVLAI